MAKTVLIADDDYAIRTVLSQALTERGHYVKSAANATTLWQWVQDGEGDVIVTDVIMPDGDGLDLIPRIRAARPDIPIIVMSAQNTILTAIKAAERGAFDYLPKPFDLKALTVAVDRALTPSRHSKTLDPAAAMSKRDRLPIIGRSAAMQEIYRIVARLISTDITTLIIGESGTGKELVARALHDFGHRRKRPFVAINMAAIPRELIESELFGYEKGSFTGATQRGIGKFEAAHGGTLFLDEIGDMPFDAQTRLLRVLQTGEFSPVGSNTPCRTDVRIIAATHRDLRQLINEGRFREDLYYRLNVVPITLPPLRDRLEDIPDLTQHFLELITLEGLPFKTLASEALTLLRNYNWPGNVRELENLMRRLVVLYSESVIDARIVADQLKAQEQSNASHNNSIAETLGQSVARHLRTYFDAHNGALPASGLYNRILHEIERPLLSISMEATRGNQIRAADLLGLNRNTLRKKLKELEVQTTRGKS